MKIHHRSRMRRKSFHGKRLGLESLESRQLLDGAGLAVEVDAIEPAPDSPLIEFSSAEALQNHLLDQSVRQWKELFGTTRERYLYLARPELDLVFDRAVGLSAGTSYTGTNVQVAGVDEGDLVKTDGEFLYIARDRQISIVDVSDPEQLRLAGRVELEQSAREIYIVDDRLIVLSMDYDLYPLIATDILVADAMWRAPSELEVEVSVFNVADPAAPELVSQLELDGALVQSRLIGTDLLLVTQDDVSAPQPECLPQEPNGTRCVYETEEVYRERVGGALLETVLPQVTISGQDGSAYLTAPSKVVATGLDVAQLISTTLIDVGASSPAVVDSAGALSANGSVVYASADSVVIASGHWREGSDYSNLLRFAFSDDRQSVDVSAFGSIPGRVINSFALDEWNNHLRVATTEGWGEDATNGVYVLQAVDGRLDIVGQVTDITPGERMRSARFLGDRGYVVTFPDAANQFIDPLVVIDLADPTSPSILGELEIPGFSTYLHPSSDGFLIGLGNDADEATGRVTNVQISLFDVRDDRTPILFDRESLPREFNAWSPALFDHHAVTYLNDLGLLAVPFHSMSRLMSDELNRPLSEPTAGLWVFQIDPAATDPIAHVGVIAHNQPVERSLRVGNALITVSYDTVMAHRFDDLSQPAGELYIGRQAFDDYPIADFDIPRRKLDVLANDHAPQEATIVAVTGPNRGGEVTISEDGKSLIYSPPQAIDRSSTAGRIDPTGLYMPDGEMFQYTIELADGTRDTATVYVRWVYGQAGRRMAELAVQDLARRLEIAPERIAVVEVVETVWPNGCLGAAQPNQLCTMSLVPGFQIWLSAEGRHYEYHTDQKETVKLVEAPRAEVVPDHFRVEQNSAGTELDVLANDFPNIAFIRAPQITAVSETDRGGQVTIKDGGQRLRYTPAPDFTGIETFTYTVDQGLSARVTVHVIDPAAGGDPSEPLIEIRLEVVDAAGNPVTQVEVGDTVHVNVLVTDLRENAEGVYSAYLDVNFDTELAAVGGSFVYSPDYNNGISGEASASGVDELGGFAGSLKPLGASERLLATIPLEALDIGQLTLTADPADILPQHVSAVYGLNSEVDLRRIRYGEAVVEIVNGFHNATEPTDANGDGVTAPTDALPIINWINEHGAGRIRELVQAERLALAAGESSPRENRRYDTNGDGYCTHMDVLLVFNRVNQDARRLLGGEGEGVLGESLLIAADVESALMGAAAEPSETSNTAADGDPVLPLLSSADSDEADTAAIDWSDTSELDEVLDLIAATSVDRNATDTIYSQL